MKHVLFNILFFVSIAIVAQNSSRTYISHKEENGILSVTTNDGEYHFQFYNSQILENTFIPKGELHNNSSHAVVLAPQKIKTRYKYLGNEITYSSKDLSVTVITNPFKISYEYKGKPVVSEKRGYYKSKHEPLEMVKGNITAKLSEKIEFNITNNEILYGAGARALGMNRRGHRLPLYNRAHYGYETDSKLMNYTMPIVASSNKYMIHFDNAPVGYLDFDSKQNNTLTYETISGRKTYQVIVGDSWFDIVKNYTDLTGKQPLPPRWAFGNFSSRFGYHSEKETKYTINKFKEEKIPVDAVILDLYWFGKDIKGTMGNLEVYKDSFPNMKQMVSDFKKQGVKTVLITEPFVLTTSNKWKEAVKENVLATDSIGNPFKFDFYFGNTGLIDIYNPKAKEWFWNIYKGLHDNGIEGIWGDLGEPEVHPEKLIHVKGTANEVHNIYGHDWARLIYEGYQKEYPSERPFILMRAGYSGSQRFGLIPWSGDVNRTWGGLQSQPEIALQIGLQGLGYMHSDLGGFAGNNLDDELYVRWLQYGVFQPIFRPHAQEEVPSEPIFRAKKAKELAKNAIELRYKMLPYNYTLAYKNHINGTPLMRPLFFEDEKLSEISSSYFWGENILVSPVLKANINKQEVIFPEGSNWFDFYTDKKYKGGNTEVIGLKETSIPTFVRGGSFIPLAKLVQTTRDYSLKEFDLHFYFDKDVKESRDVLFNDDGETANSITNKAFELMLFTSKNTKKCLKITFDTQIAANYKAFDKIVNLNVHNIQSRPKHVKINNKKVDFIYDSNQNSLKLPVNWKEKQTQKIIVNFK